MKKIYLIILVCLSACAHRTKDPYLPQKFKNADDLINVGTAVNLARSSYLLGCVDAHKELGALEGSAVKCRDKAKISVQENIISIITDDGR